MIVSMIGLGLALPGSTTSADDRTDFFEKKIRPVLVAKCYSCHSPTPPTVVTCNPDRLRCRTLSIAPLSDASTF